MNPDFQPLFASLKERVGARGVEVRERTMDKEKPGDFEGPSITLNPDYDLESRSYFLAHSFGSIVLWATDFDGSKNLFDELRTAKKGMERDLGRFARALARWVAFEEASSEYAVGLIEEAGHGWAVPGYTNYFRADIDAMTRFHARGVAPKWPEFFAEWNDRVKRGRQEVKPFRPKPVPEFRPVPIPKQEVVQEHDGKP